GCAGAQGLVARWKAHLALALQRGMSSPGIFLSKPGGLADREAKRRLAEYGPNDALMHRRRPLWRQIVERLANPLIIILLFASGLSAWTGVEAVKRPSTGMPAPTRSKLEGGGCSKNGNSAPEHDADEETHAECDAERGQRVLPDGILDVFERLAGRVLHALQLMVAGAPDLPGQGL